MAQVFIPAMLQKYTGGIACVELPGATVRDIIAGLEARFPGLAEQLTDQDRLRPSIAVAVNGEVMVEGTRSPVGSDDEIHFVGAIRGGIGPRSYC